ncbi:MAG: hypothetical protein WC644_04095 [Ignavibacteria bacterium]
MKTILNLIFYLVALFSAMISSKGAYKSRTDNSFADYQSFSYFKTPNFYRSWYINLIFGSMGLLITNLSILSYTSEEIKNLAIIYIFVLLILFMLLNMMSEKLSTNNQFIIGVDKIHSVILFGLLSNISFYLSAKISYDSKNILEFIRINFL